jgi:hypothetical protein
MIEYRKHFYSGRSRIFRTLVRNRCGDVSLQIGKNCLLEKRLPIMWMSVRSYMILAYIGRWSTVKQMQEIKLDGQYCDYV